MSEEIDPIFDHEAIENGGHYKKVAVYRKREDKEGWQEFNCWDLGNGYYLIRSPALTVVSETEFITRGTIIKSGEVLNDSGTPYQSFQRVVALKWSHRFILRVFSKAYRQRLTYALSDHSVGAGGGGGMYSQVTVPSSLGTPPGCRTILLVEHDGSVSRERVQRACDDSLHAWVEKEEVFV